MHDMWVFAGGLVAAVFAFARLSLGQQRSLMDRLMSFLDGSMERHETAANRLVDSMEQVKLSLAETNVSMRRLLETSAVQFRHGDEE